MGCDIHLVIETQPYSDGKWRLALGMEATWCRRNYPLFSWLANVRNYGEKPITPLAEPRGLPDNMSAGAREEFSELGSDGHSHSWLALEEVLQAHPPEHCDGFVEWLRALFKDERTMMGDMHRPRARLVFAFDN